MLVTRTGHCLLAHLPDLKDTGVPANHVTASCVSTHTQTHILAYLYTQEAPSSCI
jgi:hypothetical protein